MIITPLRSRSIHQNAANRFVSAILRNGDGEGYSSAHAHVIMCDPLPVVQAACRIIESSEDVSAVETVLRHGHMFQGSDEV